MKRILHLIKLIGLGALAALALIVSWPCGIAGMLLWLIFRERCPQWAISLSAILIAVTLRCVPGGTWRVKIGGPFTGDLWLELMSGVLNWGVAAILVNAGYQIARSFLKCFRTSESTKTVGFLES